MYPIPAPTISTTSSKAMIGGFRMLDNFRHFLLVKVGGQMIFNIDVSKLCKLTYIV
jgi:hypothetical protein